MGSVARHRAENTAGSQVLSQIGFGTYKLAAPRCTKAILEAISAGYCLFDTAQLYETEKQLGQAIRLSGVPRADFVVTTKIKKIQTGLSPYDACLSSIDKFGGYVDLFLIHTPFPKQQAEFVWQALEQLLQEGKTMRIGVSNYGIKHLEDMKSYAVLWPPHVNQIELHPWCQQRELVKYCQTNNIAIQAYSPLATGQRLGDPTLLAIAQSHGKTPAQVLIRYSIQKGWVPLPKSATPHRIKENLDVFDFEISEQDMERLDALDEGKEGAVFKFNVH
ncbi:putative aldo-keto reductase [Emericellopsis atlantica]|uniref:Aldo-keto reductase n=1 Tax=Emericellopsis atlantica TaxID=2614577 RepID=A0A9P8CT47_9HYPO|nr:putative aldo-keto reductase [Emericellopsis atlantica]KAG9258027.1 putative aldo-keto reductase [Emericellopsis atlantica]